MHSHLHRIFSPRLRAILLSISPAVVGGIAWFLLLFGHWPLHVSNLNWIYANRGDVFQHQIGWEWFRQEPWHFPFGRIESYGYPFGTTLSYTDSIPLVAIPLKLLSPVLKEHFQYIGAWALLSVIGQMLFGLLIIGEFTRSCPQRALGASLLVLSPPMIYQTWGHISLTAHWIILAAIWFTFLERRAALWQPAWICLFVAAELVHVYFVLMLLPLWAIGLIVRHAGSGDRRLPIGGILAVPAVLLGIGYCIGLFSLRAEALQISGFGRFSWNLNGFLNPLDTSAVFPAMPTGTTGQYEGYSYLGLGNILMLPIALSVFLARERLRSQRLFFGLFTLAAVALGVFALSNKAFLGAHLLWSIDLPARLAQFTSLFRASGRFIWPVFYFLVVFGVISLVRNLRAATPLLALVVLLQLADMKPLYSSRTLSAPRRRLPGLLDNEFWGAAAAASRHVIMIPAAGKLSPAYEPIALYARKGGLTLNTGYFSRADLGAIQSYANEAWEELQAGQPDPQTVYIFWEARWTYLAEQFLSEQMIMCQVDGYTVALSPEVQLGRQGTILDRYCASP